jgi:hypothetical protein
VQQTDGDGSVAVGSKLLAEGGRLPVASVAAFAWHQWQLCHGMSGNFRVELVAALAWHRWQASRGISGSFGVEYAARGDFRQETMEAIALIERLINLQKSATDRPVTVPVQVVP